MGRTMKLTVEISMYPLAETFRPAIAAFIERLNAYPELRVATNPLSTQLSGEYDAVFSALSTEMARVHAETGQTVFVAKFLAGDLAPGSAQQ